jgi:hypothetical protein
MLIQWCIEIFIGLWAFYYITIVIHLMGVKLFKRTEITIGKALIPFYYWFAREIIK